MSAVSRLQRLAIALVPFLVVAGCGLKSGVVGSDGPPALAVADLAMPEDLPERASVGEPVADPPSVQAGAVVAPDPGPDTGIERPVWLGTIPLPPAPADGSPLPTPAELVDRRLPPPPGGLPPPATEEYAVTIGPVPPEVVARSTWNPDCPVSLEELAYLTVVHWGFDDRVHTGELIVHTSAAEGMAEVFRRLHEVRFPIEELRVISMDDLTALSTGDGNVSSAFVCRKKVSGRSWSEHAYGLSVDLNPFHNPFVRGYMIVPGLAGVYLDRGNHRPGMIQPGDDVVTAFAAMGWQWGGDWTSAKDWMHFSANGR
jgi:hypothetical protein